MYFIEKEQHIDVEKACSDIGLCEKLSPEPVIDPLPAALVGRMASYGMRSSNDQDDCTKCKVGALSMTVFAPVAPQNRWRVQCNYSNHKEYAIV